ncbi:MAG: 2-C-methyl-D-erythritol 4-phosphate cytidylyltransferase [Eubacteriales bacterium]|nr:2-C-methyl-D-erythritol 4-phosphate cytidylyltransferase [Eubacteriales bacterium]
MDKKFCTAIVLAAGQGRRMGTRTAKQYLEIGGRPLLYYTLYAFEQSPLIDSIVLAVGDESQVDFCRESIIGAYHLKKVDKIVLGGRERYHSVQNALQAIRNDFPAKAHAGYVFIHDGARPVLESGLLRRCYEDVCRYGACVAAVPAKDTVKIADEEGFAVSTPRRDRVWQVQTPQTFSFPLIEEAYAALIREEEALLAKGVRITDDAMAVETFTDRKVKLTEGSYENIKVTTPEDLTLAEAFLRRLSGISAACEGNEKKL